MVINIGFPSRSLKFIKRYIMGKNAVKIEGFPDFSIKL